MALCDAAVARHLGVKAHTWARWADQLAACQALERLPGPAPRWRLPLYFVVRTGHGCDTAATELRRPPAMPEMGKWLQERLSNFLHLRQTRLQNRQPGSVCRARAKTRV